MRKWLLSALAVLGLGVVQAQESYFGVGLSVRSATTEIGVIPLLGLQAGGPILETLEFRVQLDTLLLTSTLAADVLYRFDVGEATHLYFGGGPNLLVNTFLIFEVRPGVHGTLGFEYAPGNVGYFLEAQPSALVAEAEFEPISVRFRAGVNFYF